MCGTGARVIPNSTSDFVVHVNSFLSAPWLFRSYPLFIEKTEAVKKVIEQLKVVWGEFIRPMMQRPRRLQVAALCYRDVGSERKVLMVTSRGTGRWIIPKGWPMNGKNSAQAALQEAWEEAGVAKGEAQDQAVGQYRYDKVKATGWTVPVEALVFPVKVKELSDSFPEADQRKRKWVSAEEAANLVREPELKAILANF